MAKRGRPTRAAASKRALAGVDVDSVDPLTVLREIASDRSAPASARLAAAKALIARGGRKKDGGDGAENDRISERALILLKGGKR
ncbi:hypothetical protein [Mesorhizobium sp. 131-2-1]|uniref:hypothetical protein n=1 Tax=Mesorhizobium sp. 131-2-1 TaxID=2744518 RepID=UPI001927EC44|nr:hypothetical protein [Mesorhizobium sp. 131-2-1]BCG94367.1 hypothetical protein MesoLj131a_32310 [Mesorhizobium sp. 131-2-1]